MEEKSEEYSDNSYKVISLHVLFPFLFPLWGSFVESCSNLVSPLPHSVSTPGDVTRGKLKIQKLKNHSSTKVSLNSTNQHKRLRLFWWDLDVDGGLSDVTGQNILFWITQPLIAQTIISTAQTSTNEQQCYFDILDDRGASFTSLALQSLHFHRMSPIKCSMYKGNIMFSWRSRLNTWDILVVTWPESHFSYYENS